ncbi:MAG TPA: LytTR family DNA-binding domain-containing protein [Chitinophagaceae bacterium]|nr:LytTR family DNA-binding domain-containing protein [Chitinophagaceae bacterium]
MQHYKCIVVEDEPLAAEVLTDYIRQVPFLQLQGICSDAIYAMEMLQREPIDLIFLDIHLPKIKGLDFIKALKNPPQVIVTSAYMEYAIQGYEVNVVDYLLKPFEFSRFLMAVNKLKSQTTREANPIQMAPGERKYLFFNISKKKVKIFLDDILYIESLKEYVRITTHEKSIMTKFQLGEMEELLSRQDFLRVHRSFIVARHKIEAFSATEVEIAGKPIPVGRSYKELVLSVIEKNG